MARAAGTSGGLYKPSVEALDALRLLSAAVQGLPDLAIEQNLLSDAGSIAEAAPGSLDATWDVALLETRLADLGGRPARPPIPRRSPRGSRS